jgi:glycosyltransferase involved in cell wall biosynthesis
VPEVIEHGVTGFIVDGIDEAVAAVTELPRLSRAGCRRAFEQRFDARRMATEYLDVYRRVIPAG